MPRKWQEVRENIKSVSESEKAEIAQQVDQRVREEERICSANKIVIKITSSTESQELDVSEGFIILYTPDGDGVVEHGCVCNEEDRAAFIAAALNSLSELDYQAVLSFVAEQRQREKETPKTKLTAIKGGKHLEAGANPGVCRVCGCTDEHACPGGCYWVEVDLCSVCAGM